MPESIALGAGWAGVCWQEPANNWGTLPGGYDLTGAKELVFYARGEKGGEIIAEFKIGGIQGEFSDSTSVSIGPIVLTPEWKEYRIKLKDEDLSHIIGGFTFVLSGMENPDGARALRRTGRGPGRELSGCRNSRNQRGSAA